MVSVRFLPYYIICSRIRSVARSDKLHEGCGISGDNGRGNQKSTQGSPWDRLFCYFTEKIPLRMLVCSIPFKENGLANIFILLKKREKNWNYQQRKGLFRGSDVLIFIVIWTIIFSIFLNMIKKVSWSV